MKIYSQSLVYLLVLVLIVSACKQRKSEQDDMTSNSEEELMEDFNRSKLIFYSLPSPIETAMIIKKAGAVYDVGLMNDVSKVDQYVTNKKKALNLGIYASDLSYASLFDKSEQTIEYMEAIKKLTRSMGISEVINDNTVESLKENISNRDMVIEIVSEALMNSDAFLKENERQATSVMVLIGGWVEGLYIATQLADRSDVVNEKLINRIIYQKLSLLTVLNILEKHKSNQDAADVLETVKELKPIFEQIKIETKDVNYSTDEESMVTIIDAESETQMSDETYAMLKEKVKEIRMEFTK